MPSVKDVVKGHTELDDDDLAWLQLLVADWQIIAYLSFADLVLWLPDREGHGYWGGAQMRPTTAPAALSTTLSARSCPRDAARSSTRPSRSDASPERVTPSGATTSR